MAHPSMPPGLSHDARRDHAVAGPGSRDSSSAATAARIRRKRLDQLLVELKISAANYGRLVSGVRTHWAARGLVSRNLARGVVVWPRNRRTSRPRASTPGGPVAVWAGSSTPASRRIFSQAVTKSNAVA